MEQEEKRHSQLPLLALLVLGLVLTALLRSDAYGLSRDAAYGDAVDAAVRPLRLERDELLTQQAALLRQLDTELMGEGVSMVVFTQLRPAVAEELAPVMAQYKLPGVLALGPEEFPGKPDCMTLAQLNALTDSGWALCVGWDGWEPLADTLAALDPLLEGAGLERPAVLYIAPGRYEAGLDEEILAAGFTIVITHGEGGHPTICRRDEGELWHLVSLSWNRSGIKATVSKLAQYGGALAMNLDCGPRRSGYVADPFVQMCRYLAQKPNHRVSTPLEAREYRAQVRGNPELEAEIAWYQGEIDELNREIEEIYREN